MEDVGEGGTLGHTAMASQFSLLDDHRCPVTWKVGITFTRIKVSDALEGVGAARSMRPRREQ